MKIGIRKPSLKKSLKARTTGKIKRKVKKAVIPGYGKKGMGILHPKKAIYNKVYNKTTIDVLKPLKSSSKTKSKSKTSTIGANVATKPYQQKQHPYVLSDIKISKTIYITLSFLGGIIGLQYLYARQYYKASLCIVACWTGIPLLFSLITGIRTIFKQADDDSKITVKGYIKNK